MNQQPKLQELIQLLDDAVTIQETTGCCHAVKSALEHIVLSGKDFIDDSFLVPETDRYARRLLHEDPQRRYVAMVMVWNVNQGTFLHDHAGKWCVECVYRGSIKVVSYSHEGSDGDLYQFRQETTIFAGPGDAGALIPPFEYHTLENASTAPTVTLHVYGGEMDWCNVFVPSENGYRMERRQLAYTS